jgi:CRP-like cAMP-binding protein
LDSSVRTANGFLASLSSADFELLRPHLRTVELLEGKSIVRTGQPFQQAYLPRSGIIASVVNLLNGERVEAAMVGRDSILGAFSTLGDPYAIYDVSVILPGVAWVIDVTHLRAAARQSEDMLGLLVRHGQALLAQAQQSAACNAAHAVEQRFVRCLLRVSELARNGNVQLTQEKMAEMIGARRNSVSFIAHSLRESGVINYSRGNLEIRDIDGLRKLSCECHEAVSTQYARLLSLKA